MKRANYLKTRSSIRTGRSETRPRPGGRWNNWFARTRFDHRDWERHRLPETEQLVADLIADLEQRRLNPTPAAPDAVTEASPTPMSMTPMAPPPEAAAPVLPELPSPSESFVSASISPSDSLTIHSVMTISSSAGESTTVTPSGAESLTTGTPVAAAPFQQPPTPQLPPVSLEGLPDAPTDLAYVIVIEAGASDYSASPVAREEFPDLDATTRGTISIGRRLQDPLAELVKIDPQHIGVGLYQHDVKQKHLKESLEAVIGSSVNAVGVDLNTASVPLLRHVSGLNQLVAREVVSHRERNGKFASREQLLAIPGLGEKRYTQAAGFLKIADGGEPLDETWIHPESYSVVRSYSRISVLLPTTFATNRNWWRVVENATASKPLSSQES